MTLENEVCDSLDDLGYPKLDVIQRDVSLLTQLNTFSSIVEWLSFQLQRMANFESTVNPITDESDLPSFKIELNSLLRELNSPFIDSPLLSNENKLSIINTLCGELLSSRMNYVNEKSGINGSMSSSMAISMNESQTAKDLKTILITLGMGKPPNNITANILFKKIKDKLSERFKLQKLTIEDSLLLPNGLTLSPKQWQTLESINEELFNDYSLRREMLLRRCDFTVNSFSWKTNKSDDHSKAVENQINSVYAKERELLSTNPNVTLAEALAARESDCDQLLNAIVSNNHASCLIRMADKRDKANQGLQQLQQLHKYVIGAVPDRGGRPQEQPPPPKESFNQQQFQRDNPHRGRGRGGGGGGGGRGGQSSGGGGGGVAGFQSQNQQRIQGTGWTQNSGNRHSNNSGFDNQTSSRGGYRGDQQNYNNYQSGHQRYTGRDEYQQNTGYQSPQQQWNVDYQQQYIPQSIDYYNQQQPYDKQVYNYSDQSYYGNNSRQQYQQQSDGNHYNDQRDRNHNRGGGYRRGGRR